MSEQQLPEGWQMVKFGDIAKHISKRVEPSETDLGIYVGLEHLDPDSLKIKRHGVPSDVAGQKLLVKKGQIIFGKRRAYQRKVGVADWDCICSAHAMVLEANPTNVLPDFLPFFMQSDVFMSRAVAISEGSLSPTIKWKVLSDQLFKIPPINRQKKLCKLFRKNAQIIENYNDSLLSCDRLINSIRIDNLRLFNPFDQPKEIPGNWSVKNLEEIANVERGKFTPRPRNNPIYYGGKYPFIQTGDIGRSNLFIENHDQTLNEHGIKVSKLFPENTVFITIAANIGDVAMSTYPVAATDSVVAIRPMSGVDPLWLLFYMSGLKAYLDSVATESAQKNINLGVLKPLKIAVPPLDLQKRFGALMLSLMSEKKNISSAKESALNVSKGFI